MMQGGILVSKQIQDLQQSVVILLEAAMYTQALQVLQNGLKHTQTQSDYQIFVQLLLQFPNSIQTSTQAFRRLYIHLLCVQQKYPEIRNYLENHPDLTPQNYAELQLEYALCLADQRMFAEAAEILNAIVLVLEHEPLGQALAGLGYCQFEQNQSWEEHFIQCKPLLHGLLLARALINYGYCLFEDGQLEKARNLWTEALPLVKSRVKTTAHVLGNLALVNQELFEIELAENYYLQLERLSHKPEASIHRTKALRGIASTRQIQGEWSRAESALLLSLNYAKDAFDKSAAYRGLARVYLLSGRTAKALELLEFAHLEVPEYTDTFKAKKARVLLALGNHAQAKVLLESLPTLHKYTDHWQLEFTRAEIARWEGQFEQALSHLSNLPLKTFLVREEAMCFPELMALLESRGLQIPEPLRYYKNLHIEVRASGVLEVFVNQRQLYIPPTSRVAELLVFLLEHGGKASTEQICDALYPNVELAQAKKSLWNIANVLHKTLGWEKSIKNLRGAYQLDPVAHWQYDIAEARQRKQTVDNFFTGVYSDWALEVGVILEGGLEKSST
jgi:tetratricopeptide (TPR) repeat protein